MALTLTNMNTQSRKKTVKVYFPLLCKIISFLFECVVVFMADKYINKITNLALHSYHPHNSTFQRAFFFFLWGALSICAAYFHHHHHHHHIFFNSLQISKHFWDVFIWFSQLLCSVDRVDTVSIFRWRNEATCFLVSESSFEHTHLNITVSELYPSISMYFQWQLF